MSKLKREDHIEFFDVILEDWDIEIIDDEHAKGTSFYSKLLYVIEDRHRDLFPNVKDFDQYIGTWSNDDYVIRDVNWGVETNDIQELTKVKKETITVTTTEWVPVETVKEDIDEE